MSSARLISLMAACLLLASCAQTGPPLPPSLELPKTPTDLRASRKGDKVTLKWTEPTRTTDRQTIRSLGTTLICRSTEREMTDCKESPLSVAPLPRLKISSANPAANEQTYLDTLPYELQSQNPSGDVTYALSVENRDGRSAGLSNQIHVPSAPTLPAPSDLAAQLSGDGVVLTWTGVVATSSPDIQHRYRIYRRNDADSKDAIAGEIPVQESGTLRFVDSSFEWEKTYTYRVTAVSIVARPPAAEVQVEGDDSPAIRVVAHDIFPPAVPVGLQAVYSGEGQKPFIDLIWAPVTNADLAGYNVYRKEGDTAPVRLNTDLVKSPSYRDSAVQPGRTYVYSVSAADVRGNESALSDEASEAVP
jgi:hypothetical protein